MSGLIGIKCGSTRMYSDNGAIEQVTIIKVDSNFVTMIKTDQTDGYKAVQLASIVANKPLNKPTAGHYAKVGVANQKVLKEFSLTEQECADLKVGSAIGVDFFDDSSAVAVTAISKGKGFAGCIKRHNFSAQRATHGNSLSHRAPGSIGQCQFPGRVNKGKKMAGQMGSVQRTMRNLKVMQIDKEKGLLVIKGSVPGKNGAIVFVKKYSRKSGE